MARKASAKKLRDASTAPYSPSASLVLSTSALSLSIVTGAWLLPCQLWGVDLTSDPLTSYFSSLPLSLLFPSILSSSPLPCSPLRASSPPNHPSPQALFLPAALLIFSLPPFSPSPSVQNSAAQRRGMQPGDQFMHRIAHITTAIVLTCLGAFAAALAATAFGAPTTLQSIPVTLHWSSLLSLLAVLPSALLFGSHTHLWRSVLLQFSHPLFLCFSVLSSIPSVCFNGATFHTSATHLSPFPLPVPYALSRLPSHPPPSSLPRPLLPLFLPPPPLLPVPSSPSPPPSPLIPLPSTLSLPPPPLLPLPFPPSPPPRPLLPLPFSLPLPPPPFLHSPHRIPPLQPSITARGVCGDVSTWGRGGGMGRGMADASGLGKAVAGVAYQQHIRNAPGLPGWSVSAPHCRVPASTNHYVTVATPQTAHCLATKGILCSTLLRMLRVLI
ncbi:unnamed protein product [Closterium sp. Naga37s-1]|nr:unnamed protein product [Closterium sp. Naga37s-1]